MIYILRRKIGRAVADVCVCARFCFGLLSFNPLLLRRGEREGEEDVY